MKRLYENVLSDHFKHAKQMAFVCGPRQVGKTTLAKALMATREQSSYRNWDIPKDRIRIAASAFNPLLENLTLSSATYPLLILDEIHKYSDWKNDARGLFSPPSGALLRCH